MVACSIRQCRQRTRRSFQILLSVSMECLHHFSCLFLSPREQHGAAFAQIQVDSKICPTGSVANPSQELSESVPVCDEVQAFIIVWLGSLGIGCIYSSEQRCERRDRRPGAVGILVNETDPVAVRTN